MPSLGNQSKENETHNQSTIYDLKYQNAMKNRAEDARSAAGAADRSRSAGRRRR